MPPVSKLYIAAVNAPETMRRIFAPPGVHPVHRRRVVAGELKLDPEVGNERGVIEHVGLYGKFHTATVSHNRLGLFGSLIGPGLRLGRPGIHSHFPDLLLAGVLAAVGQTPQALRLRRKRLGGLGYYGAFCKSQRGEYAVQHILPGLALAQLLKAQLTAVDHPSVFHHPFRGVYDRGEGGALPLGVAFLDFPAKHSPVCAERFYRLDLGRLEQARQHGGTHGRQGVVLVGIALGRRTAANAHRHYVLRRVQHSPEPAHRLAVAGNRRVYVRTALAEVQTQRQRVAGSLGSLRQYRDIGGTVK